MQRFFNASFALHLLMQNGVCLHLLVSPLAQFWCFMHITAYLSVLCVVCPLVLGCQGKACLSTCCLSPGVLKEAPGEGMSVGFVPCMGQVNAQVRTRTS